MSPGKVGTKGRKVPLKKKRPPVGKLKKKVVKRSKKRATDDEQQILTKVCFSSSTCFCKINGLKKRMSVAWCDVWKVNRRLKMILLALKCASVKRNKNYSIFSWRFRRKAWRGMTLALRTFFR